jgi:cyclophilin family peptidyl-prolyl cis-trans isomerase
MCIDSARTYTERVVTNLGALTINLDPVRAPLTVNSFVTLARYKYFDATQCHRAIPGFVVQCGDPTATGTGGPGYSFADELPEAGDYKIGSVAMANSGPNTNGSQFFLISGLDGAALPPKYSLFGMVTDGLATTLTILDAFGNPDNNGVPPLAEIRIESVTITES